MKKKKKKFIKKKFKSPQKRSAKKIELITKEQKIKKLKEENIKK